MVACVFLVTQFTRELDRAISPIYFPTAVLPRARTRPIFGRVAWTAGFCSVLRLVLNIAADLRTTTTAGRMFPPPTRRGLLAESRPSNCR